MSPTLGRHPTRRRRGRIRKAGRHQPACASAIRAGGVDPIADYLRLRNDTCAGSAQQLGSARIGRFFSSFADGLPRYWAKCATQYALADSDYAGHLSSKARRCCAPASPCIRASWWPTLSPATGGHFRHQRIEAHGSAVRQGNGA